MAWDEVETVISIWNALSTSPSVWNNITTATSEWNAINSATYCGPFYCDQGYYYEISIGGFNQNWDDADNNGSSTWSALP